MLIRIVRMTFQPDKIDDFLRLFEEVREQIIDFEGCTKLELMQDYNEEHIFLTYSHWKDESSLNYYRNSPLFKSTWATTKSLFQSPPLAFSMRQYKGQ